MVLFGLIMYFCASIARYASMGPGTDRSGYCNGTPLMVNVSLKVKKRS